MTHRIDEELSHRSIMLNEDSALMAVSLIEDLVTRNLVKLGIGRTIMQFLRFGEESYDEWKRRLPVAPFDMLFMVNTLVAICKQHEAIRGLLDGLSVPQATGWDV